MSVPGDLLDEENRASITKFYGEVFGFEEHAMLTADRKRLVLGACRADQFLYIIANDDPMICPRLDHWGMSVESEEQLDLYLDRAKKFREEDSRVDIVDKHVEDYSSARAQVVLRRVPAADDGRSAVLRLQGLTDATTSRRGC